MRRTYQRLFSILTVVLAALLAGCGSGFDKDFPARIAAPATFVRVNQTIQTTNQSLITGSPMAYWVNGIAWGNARLGTIDKNGLYTAPALVPFPDNTVTITSQATNFPQDTPGSVKLSIFNPIPIINTVSPAALTEGTTTIEVNGSQFIYGAQIWWNGTVVPTTYVSGSKLAAAIFAPTPGSYPLTVSNPDPGSATAATMTELVGPGQVVITLRPNPGTSVRVSNSMKVATSVTGTGNTGVNWLINGVANGNATIGTITADADGSVTYTAPAVVPTPSNLIQLTATSVDKPIISASQNIAVMNPIPILFSASPLNFDPGQTTVILSGNNFISGAQVLVNSVPVPTTFNSGSQLTANVTASDPGELDLQVLNPAPGPAISTNLIARVNGTQPVPLVSPEDASRFLAQATFGATDGDIHHLSKIGYKAWLAEQFNTPALLHAPIVEQALMVNNPPCAGTDSKCNAALFVQNNTNESYLQQTFWQQSMTANDQLRQRVKYALTQLMVISSTNSAVAAMPRGMANYYDVLGKDAFGNFRQLLEDVTLSPMMGKFLSMLANDKGDATRDPDENYAREVMQLFTIGLYQLNPDGTQRLDPTGQPIPTYSNLDVMGLAKVFTGFSWNIPGDRSDTAWYNCCAYVGPGYGEDLRPMQSFPGHHSTAEKSFLGVNTPTSPNPDPAGDLKIALDTLFNHPNLPPFFCKQMIQHLVTSNPSPAYVSRVAGVFQDNGQGVRGDMKSVLQAILLDDEARDAYAAKNNVEYGKVRESLIRYTQWARAFTAQSRNGVFNLGTTEDPIYGLGEMSLRSPSVFNWFTPGYVPPGTSLEKAGLLAPEMQMTDVSTVVGYLNFMQGAIGATATAGSDVFSSYSTEVGFATQADQLVDRINLLLMAGSMDNTLRAQILSAVSAVVLPASDPSAVNAALTLRVKLAIYLTMASPSYGAQF